MGRSVARKIDHVGAPGGAPGEQVGDRFTGINNAVGGQKLSPISMEPAGTTSLPLISWMVDVAA